MSATRTFLQQCRAQCVAVALAHCVLEIVDVAPAQFAGVDFVAGRPETKVVRHALDHLPRAHLRLQAEVAWRMSKCRVLVEAPKRLLGEAVGGQWVATNGAFGKGQVQRCRGWSCCLRRSRER